MYGRMGTILRVDLSREEIVKEALPEEIASQFVGGRGLNVKFLYDELRPGVDPLGPDNKIIVGNGPCNGTLVPGSTRFDVTYKSPLTGFLGDSNCGGSLGVALKYAGYDLVILQGMARRPLYLWIDDDRVELRSAGHLWGKTTKETRRILEVELGDPDVSILCIGPAGEKMVKFACLIADLGRAAGRAGGGAVFGSKNLKAVAVRGKKGVKVANPGMLEEAWQEMYRAWRDDPKTYDNRRKFGTGGEMVRYYEQGVLCTKNGLQEPYPGIEAVNPQRLAETYTRRPKACFSCPVPCQHVHVIDSGPYVGEYGEGFELSHFAHLGSRLLSKDLDFVVKASILCNEYGMDVVEVGQFLGYVMECFEKGILTSKDMEGLSFEWGSTDGPLCLIERVAHREGIGDLFAEGIRTASRKIGKGSERLVQMVKGQASPNRDPRGSKGWGLAYAVSSRGADHCRSLIRPEIKGSDKGFDPIRGEVEAKPGNIVDPLTEEGKGQMVKWYEDLRGFQYSMQMCSFNTIRYPVHLGMPGTLAKFYNAVAGTKLSETDCLQIGERIVNLERAFNIREGLTRKDDTLCRRFLEEPMPAGPAKGEVVHLDAMLDDYYEARGWDKRTGVPTREKLEELGLKEVADDLGQRRTSTRE